MLRTDNAVSLGDRNGITSVKKIFHQQRNPQRFFFGRPQRDPDLPQEKQKPTVLVAAVPLVVSALDPRYNALRYKVDSVI